jgi:hypothetical protein
MKVVVNNQNPGRAHHIEPERVICAVYKQRGNDFVETGRELPVLVLPSAPRGCEPAPLVTETGWRRHTFYDNQRAGTSELACWFKPLHDLAENEFVVP